MFSSTAMKCKATTAANLAVLLARQHRRVLVIDSDPQYALTRQLGAEDRSPGVNLVDELAGFSYHAILRAIRRGDLQAFEPVPGHYRIEVIEYERWLRHPARRNPAARTEADSTPRAEAPNRGPDRGGQLRAPPASA